ncbi:hypothetical protein Sgri01_07241 [Streptomyces griseus]
MIVTPPASASEHSPDRSAWAARCVATNEEEHAVSTVIDGPSRPSPYETRPDVTAPALPVPTTSSLPLGAVVNRLA